MSHEPKTVDNQVEGAEEKETIGFSDESTNAGIEMNSWSMYTNPLKPKQVLKSLP